MLIIVVGGLLVFGGYYVWTGFLSFLEDRGNITADVTRQAFSTATAQAATMPPTAFVRISATPLPPCQYFRTTVNAKLRECPAVDDINCPHREIVPPGTELCVYSRARENTEWYVVELNPGGAFRDIVYVSDTVVEPVNPTPEPTDTLTPLPTITLTPTPAVPTPPPATPTDTADPSLTDTPAPTITPSPSPPVVTL